MAKIEVILNGNKIITEDNQTILDLAKKNNIEIPTLCKDPRLAPITSCFVCVVEVKGAKTLVPSCATQIVNGMEINTDSERVLESRKTALELILSNHYGDCIAPCKLTCPANLDIQGYVGLIANKKYKDAIKLIKENIPLPSSIGRVCPRFCEEKCRRQYIEESISINYLKRFVADLDLFSKNPYTPLLKPKTGKKVAIIGGGPAGLSSAYYLIQNGIDADIYEAKSKLGGMIYYGVPGYRLPKEVVNKEVQLIIQLGVKVHYNKVLGINFTIDDLKKQGYDAIILAMGAWNTRGLEIPNEEAEGVFDGIKYLERLNEGEKIKLDGKVAVIGGGNTAFDCARTALRIGAREVVIIYRRTIEEMPANKIEIQEAEEEGIKFQFLTAPVKVIHEHNKVKALECIKMGLGEPDSSGRKKPVPIENSNFIEKFDYIISAIGQSPDYNILGEYKEKLIKGKWLNYDQDTGQTNIDNVFTAGDYATGAATVVEALAGGKKACLSIIKLFNNETLKTKKEFISTREDLSDFADDFFNKWDKIPREFPKVLKPEIRKNTFNEIESIFSEKQAEKESNRCMECGCMDVYQCDLKKYSEEYDATESKYKGAFNTPEDDNSHEFIFREPEKCILCGRCILLCKEKINIGVYGFIDRGFKTTVGLPFDDKLKDSQCISCGACISGCPVGALVPKTLKKKKVPLKGNKINSYCSHCSIGCKNTIELLYDSIYDIYEHDDYLCEKGRFIYPEKKIDSFDSNYEILKDYKDAQIFPSGNLSNEDYEALKFVSKKMNWKLMNYFSQSTLWQAFASIKSLPKMDFFNKKLEDESIVIFAGDIENKHPIAINHLNNILKKNSTVILLNKKETLRLKNLNCVYYANPKELENHDLKKGKEIILLINPIDFDNIYGYNSALLLYNYLTKKFNTRTTLFSETKNLYSFYDSNNIHNDKEDDKESKKIFIMTKPNVTKNYIHFSSTLNTNELYLPDSIQNDGFFLNSKNEYYKNEPILNDSKNSLYNILCNVFMLKKNELQLLKHKNIDLEKPIDFNSKVKIKFPPELEQINILK